jgi:uroporphyrinogen-III synthase
MRVIVTRVQPQAQVWASSLSALGHPAIALPLIEVAPLADKRRVIEAWEHWEDYNAVMFVSAAAVTYFFKEKPPATLVEQARAAINTRVWVTGPGSRAAVLAQGIDPALIDAPAHHENQFDSEALWRRVATSVSAGTRVLIVRGSDSSDEVSTSSQGLGRDWLAQQVQKHGGLVDFVVAYQRQAPVWSAQQLALAQTASSDGSVWLFSSSEAVQHLQNLLQQQDWSRASAIATHPRIAQAAQALGFIQVKVASATIPAVLASIESLA